MTDSSGFVHAPTFSYLDAAPDQRLGEIWHKDSGSQTISKFDHEYDVRGQITKWTQQAGATPAQAYEFGYDPVGQLKSAILKDVSGAVLKSYSYDYDGAGNRTVEGIDSLVKGDTLNNLNQLTSRQGGTGVLPIRGTTNEPSSSVTVNGTAAIVKSDNSFEGKASVTAGDNMVTVAATDVSGNTATNRYNVTVTGSGSKTLVYDANGNLTSDGTRTFEWDPLNRLTAVNSGTQRSEFTYNGLSQRVKIIEKTNGSVTSTKQFVWCPGDPQPGEERDGSNNVTKRYYTQGVQIGSTNYYYTRDHLGSIREMTDGTGAVQTRYDYDPYGRRTRLTGTIDADFGFTGHYYHQPSGLHLALYRAYDADLGRWISRDPIGEDGGINIYAYVLNNPIILIDPLGLINWGQVGNGVLGVVGGIAATAAVIALTSTGVGTVLAPIAAVEAAAGYSYGIGNIIAGLADNPSNHDEAQKMLHSPANLGGAVGRCLGASRGDADGGQHAQDIGSLADNLISYGAGFGLSPEGVGAGESAIWLGGQVSSGAGAVQDSVNLIAPSPTATPPHP